MKNFASISKKIILVDNLQFGVNLKETIVREFKYVLGLNVLDLRTFLTTQIHSRNVIYANTNGGWF